MGVPISNTSCCEVCEATISFFEAMKNKERALNICGAIECCNVMQQKTSMPEQAFQVYLRSHQQMLRHRKQRAALKEKLREQQAKENKRLFKQAVSTLSHSGIEPKHQVVIPTGLQQELPIPQERIANYRTHLEKVVAEALTYKSIDDAPKDNNQEAHQKLLAKEKRFMNSPRLKAMSDRFCMLCKGGCCSRGEDHAYLSASHMRRVLDQQPELTAEQLVDQYLGYLGDASIANACINQTSQGCALPRALRSSTCNQFHCGSITKYQNKIHSDDDVEPVVVVQREQTLWDRGHDNKPNRVTGVVLITESGNQLLKLVLVQGLCKAC